jgi:hypothetical protein
MKKTAVSRSGLKKTKKLSVSSAKKRAWSAFSRWVRLRSALETTGTTTHARCCTCGGVFPAFGVGCLQAGHFIAGRNNAILFAESGCHAQCYICNVVKKGAGVEYFVFMEEKYGREEIDRLRALSHTIVQLKPFELIEIAEKYEKKAEELCQQKTS